jgi:hypothetical protein
MPGLSKDFKVFKQIEEVNEYAKSNDMKIKLKKTKVMLFNHCRSLDFMPTLTLEGNEI